jgi:nucleotide-binding universal stress UspA family protein
MEGILMRTKTVLCATDFSTTSRHALNQAFSLARDQGARVVLLHVVEPPFFGDEPLLLTTTLDKMRAEAESRLAGAPMPGGIEAEHVIAEGDPVTEILRVAAEQRADFIVLGTHGRTGVTRLVMGSVAENVVRQATCPVVIAKKPTPAKADLPPWHAAPKSAIAAPC